MNRIKIVQDFLKNSTVDAVIMNSSVNRKYILDISSSAGTILIFKDSAYFIIDFRYIEKAKATIKTTDCEVILQGDLYKQIREIFKKHDIKSLGIEDDVVTVAQLNSLEKAFEEINIVKESGLFECIQKSRSSKSPEEIATLIQAQKITDNAFLEILNFIKKDKTEREIANYLEYTMKKNGADGLSFDTIVVGGVNSSLPHGKPSDYKVQNGDFITMDFGAVVDGYHADMTRTVAVGEVNEEKLRVYTTVLTAQTMVLQGVKVGMKCSDVDKIARDYIYKNGYKGCFGHGLGHSVGLEIHENPNFSPRDEEIVRNGNAITVEPGIYLENKFGVRIEDVIIVQNNEIIDITNSKKELIIL